MKNNILFLLFVAAACNPKPQSKPIIAEKEAQSSENLLLRDTIFYDDPKPTTHRKEIALPSIISTPIVYSDGYYKHLRGTIGDASIVMDLTVTSIHSTPENLVIGAFTYEKRAGLHLFEGKTVGDSLIFIERDNIQEMARFALKRFDETQFEGSRTDLNTQKVSKVSLSEAETKVKFSYFGARDSIDIVKIGKKILNAPQLQIQNQGEIIDKFHMYFERHYLLPNTGDYSLDTLIQNRVSNLFPTDSFNLSASPTTNFVQLRNHKFNEYLELFVNSYDPSLKKPKTQWHNYYEDAYLDKRTYFVLCNDDHFLTIAYLFPLKKFLEYRRTRVISFDLQTRKMIHVEDFLSEKQKEALQKIIQNSINQYFTNTKNPKNIGGEVSIEGYWQFVDIDEDGDFGITPKGLFIAGFKKFYGDMPWTMDWEQVKSSIEPAFYKRLQK